MAAATAKPVKEAKDQEVTRMGRPGRSRKRLRVIAQGSRTEEQEKLELNHAKRDLLAANRPQTMQQRQQSTAAHASHSKALRERGL